MGEDSAGALRGKRVVVTRAEEQSRDLVQVLSDRGAVAIVLPMVAFGPPDNFSDLDGAIRGLGHFDWIFLTSQNALRALQDRCEALNLELKAAAGKARVAAVGPATAEAARMAGIGVSYVAAKHQGVFLAEELAAQVQNKRVFLPRSNRANPELADQLKRQGAMVTEVVAYKTISPDQGTWQHARMALHQGADAILFFSPSAVHHLQDILGNEKVCEISRRSIFAAIGPITEKALRAAKIERVLLAEDTTVASIVKALENYFFAARPGISAGVKPG